MGTRQHIARSINHRISFAIFILHPCYCCSSTSNGLHRLTAGRIDVGCLFHSVSEGFASGRCMCVCVCVFVFVCVCVFVISKCTLIHSNSKCTIHTATHTISLVLHAT